MQPGTGESQRAEVACNANERLSEANWILGYARFANMARMAPKQEHKRNKTLCELRATLKLSQTAMGKKIGVNLRAYQNYEAGRPIPKPVQILIDLLKSGAY